MRSHRPARLLSDLRWTAKEHPSSHLTENKLFGRLTLGYHALAKSPETGPHPENAKQLEDHLHRSGDCETTNRRHRYHSGPDRESASDHKGSLTVHYDDYEPSIDDGSDLDPSIWDWIDAIGREIMANKLGLKGQYGTEPIRPAAIHTITVVDLWPDPMRPQ